MRLARLAELAVHGALRVLLPRRDRGEVMAALDEAAARRRGRGDGDEWRSVRDAARALPLALRARLPRVARPVPVAAVLDELTGAARRLRRRPGPTLVVTLILALGTVTGTAAYGLFDVVTRTDSGLDGEGLRILRISSPETPDPRVRHPAELFRALREADLPVRPVASTHREVIVRTDDGTTSEWSALVSPAYFEVVRIPLLVGRAPTLDAALPEVVISHELWRRRLGGDAEIVGGRLNVGGEEHRIVGVASAGVRGLQGHAAVWRIFDPSRVDFAVRVLFRFPAESEEDETLARVSALEREHSGAEGALPSLLTADDLSLTALERVISGDRSALAVILMGLLLALATAANAANVLVADHLERRRELAVRAAVGAGPGRLVALLVSETAIRAVLVVAATVVGSQVALLALPAWNPTPVVPGFSSSGALPAATAIFAVVVAGGTCLLASMAPAFALLGRSRRSRDRRTPTGRGFAVVQVAIATALAIAAATVGLAVLRVHEQPLGYEESDRFFFRVNLGSVPEEDDVRARAMGRLSAALRADPAVLRVGVVDTIPAFQRAAWNVTTGDASTRLGWIGADAGYFETVGLELLHGRVPGPDAPNEILLSARAARELRLPGNGTGGSLRLDRDERERQVVGIVADGTYTAPEVVPMMFSPVASRRASTFLFVVHSTAPVRQLREVFRAAAVEAHPLIPEAEPIAVAEWFQRAWYLDVTSSAIVRLFATVSLVVSALGLLAAFARLVRAQRHELGVRLALGASPSRLFRRIMARGLRIAGLGVAIGAGLALLAGGALRGMVVGAQRPAPVICIAVGAVVAIGAAITMLWPAAQAASVDPTESLREGRG